MAHFPKFSLVLLPSLISFELGLSLLAGYIAALFLSGSKSQMPGIIPSLILKFRRYRIHLHHWLIFSPILLASIMFHFFVVSPFLFYGVLGGIVAHGLLHYDDWYIIAQKV